MAEPTELERDLRQLEKSLRELENEYNMFFAGQRARPPVAERARVEKVFRRYDRAYVQSLADRYRLNTLQSRFNAFADLWDRGLRAREEGRPGPFARAGRSPAEHGAVTREPADRVLCVTTVSDPAGQREQVLALYESLVEARRAAGQDAELPFSRFAQMVKTQVAKLHESGNDGVAFRVAVQGSKVSFTARGVKGSGPGEEGGG